MKRYQRISTKQFRKDIRRMDKSGFDLSKIKAIIDRLSADEALPERFHDHALRGALAGARECHIAPDWLLVYSKDRQKLLLLLIRTGTHRDALGME